MSQTDLQQRLFAELKQRENLRSIYRSLHLVGDDDTKAAIEDDLKELLTPDAYKTVQAVFAIYTDRFLSTELEEKGFFGPQDEVDEDVE